MTSFTKQSDDLSALQIPWTSSKKEQEFFCGSRLPALAGVGGVSVVDYMQWQQISNNFPVTCSLIDSNRASSPARVFDPKSLQEDMKKKRIHAAPKCHSTSGSSFWVSRFVPFLLLLFMPGISCNDAAACTDNNLLCQILRGISGSTPSGLPPPLSKSPCDGFRCGSSECLDFKKVCNQVPDCADMSDENPAACINRTCNFVMDLSDLKRLGSGLVRLDSVVRSWRCDNGECISDVYRCDGQRNCADGSDETPLACFDRSCTTAQFTCKTGQCIRNSNLCDGKQDCFDGSDEDSDTCRIHRRNRPRVICPARVMNYCADRAQCYQKIIACVPMSLYHTSHERREQSLES
ncbi:Low-density lipoprotein (LDL) receptor class A repeat [Trinorchestia longiramus]|nr:Low-density lipoprotein (LDL) receptor class A repeat [Trinorchestia longiramus]